ncbi:MAG: hypothetical protein HY681_05500 [Chloroflexi bacterium]|nr:hypothetical protein [Chloroflexota bacterium]
MFKRALRAARFDSKLYQEIADDPVAFVQAVGIMVISALAFGLGIKAGDPLEQYANKSYVTILLWSFSYHAVAWALLGSLTYAVRRLRARQPVPLVATLNGIGFAHIPGVLYALLSLGSEYLMILTNMVVLAGMLVGLAVAFRQTTKAPTSLSFLMAVIGTILVVQVRNDLLVRIVL